MHSLDVAIEAKKGRILILICPFSLLAARGALTHTANQYHIEKRLARSVPSRIALCGAQYMLAGRCAPRDYHSALQEPVLQRTVIVPRYTAAGKHVLA